MSFKNKFIEYKKITSFILCMLLITSPISLIGCTKNKDKVEENKVAADKNNTTDIKDKDKIPENKDQESGAKDNKSNAEEEETGKEEENTVKFVKHQLDKKIEPEFGTEWENSVNKKLSACIEGKGPDAEEEGIGKIYLKDLSSGEKWALEVVAGENQNSPKSIEWIDDENIISIVGLGYGTVALGGNVYKINTKTGKTTLLYDTKNSRKQVISAKKVENKLELQILVYDDEELMKNHTEKMVIDLK
ncbi:DUF4652 domain-containing protein [Clostridium ganghwense]|uniref:DUF4652 domain-containing protein n=1 Tax=Clostridium ganghwense TaxID=312089 RepID=A0ABT4CR40_9CLOT|nr:DUF4652 domain-containing protein [Clostridium ganghwense]MCY6371512.1 DUF4652 domain-containing protein [Clostridium ganghwense]